MVGNSIINFAFCKYSTSGNSNDKFPDVDEDVDFLNLHLRIHEALVKFVVNLMAYIRPIQILKRYESSLHVISQYIHGDYSVSRGTVFTLRGVRMNK